MSRRFDPRNMWVLGAAAMLATMGAGCIEAARSTPDALVDAEAGDSSDTAETADLANDDGMSDAKEDVVAVEIIEPECVNASHCNGEAPDTCQAWACEDNKCVVRPVATDARCVTDDPCSPRACAEGMCKTSPLEDGASCDNDLFCDGVALCKAGVCSEGSDPCAITPNPVSCIGSFTCNEVEDHCEPVYRGPDAATYLANGRISTETCGALGAGLCVDKRCVPGDMRFVPEGVFRMGCNDSGREGDVACETNAQPAHPVYLADFAVGRYEATFGRWEACVTAGASGCTKTQLQAQRGTTDEDINLPVHYLTYDQAAALCAFEGRRLCTEAEWEKAARGPWNRVAPTEPSYTYPWGNSTPVCDRANSVASCGLTNLAPFDAKPDGASQYSVLNMAGNVAEWVADAYDSKAYANRTVESDNVDPVVQTSQDGGPMKRVLRGGHYTSATVGELKTFRRVGVDPNDSAANPDAWRRGVRCCATIAVETPTE